MSFSLWSRFSAVVVACVVAVGVVFGAAQITSGSTNSTKETVFVGIVPARLLDTRQDQITFDGFDQAVGRLDADTTYELDIAGRAGIPIDAASVTANFVAVDPSGPGHLTVYPCSVDRPLASALNYMPGVNNANEFSVPLGPDGDICIYTYAETDIVVDIYGYYIASSGGAGTPGQDGADGKDGEDAESPARVIWVADDGTGDFLKLSTALVSIEDATATKPYVIKIAPGVYTETARVAMKDYVDVEGSGQNTTTINCACSNSLPPSAAVISADAITAEIRHLTINNTGGNNNFSAGVYTKNVANESFSMLHVTATATGGTNNFGVYNSSSSPTMNNVTATATGGTFSYGVYNYAASPTMTNVTATATGGTNNFGVYNPSSSSPTMTNVTATATGGTDNNWGVYNSSSSPTMTNVTATATGGTESYGVYNNSSSPTMNNVTATATDGTNNYGVNNANSSSPSMTNVTATATGGTFSYGVYNESSSPSMNNVTATATGGTNNYGVINQSSSSPTMNNVTATATGGTNNFGVYNDSSSPTIRNSSITGTTNSIVNNGSTAQVADTALGGGNVAGGGFTCVGAYTTAFIALPDSDSCDND